MARNIVICIDGTGNEFGANNSNVIKLYSVLKRDDASQVGFYHPGLGTMGAPNAFTKFQQWWTRTCGLAFGYGLSSALEDCYTYLMEQFEEDDTIFIFGFSRGAYLARALAAMVHMYGLMQKGNEPLIRYVLKMFTKKKRTDADFALAASFKATFSRECKMHFVGVWDTVSSVGWLYDPLSLPFTRTNPDIEIGRQAISIDERRAAFRQNLWALDPKYSQDIQQIWFAGVHSDVGGGYAEPESGLSKITLQWMLGEAEAKGLAVDHVLKDQVLGFTDPEMAKPDCMGILHKSLTGWWWILEIFPRRHFDTRLTPPEWKWELPLASPRYIAPGSSIHPTVAQRIAQNPTYRPPNLPR
jgi:uncharacterized protein (DUF2235 family)